MSLCGTQEPAQGGTLTKRCDCWRAVLYYYLPGGRAIWYQVTGDPQTHTDLAPLFHSRCAILLDGHWAADFLCAASVRAIFLDLSPVIDGAHRH